MRNTRTDACKRYINVALDDKRRLGNGNVLSWVIQKRDQVFIILFKLILHLFVLKNRSSISSLHASKQYAEACLANNCLQVFIECCDIDVRWYVCDIHFQNVQIYRENFQIW